MSLDLKYRPQRFENVLGQRNVIKIIKALIKRKRGFQQSYILAGHHGIGKTSIGRILARALLCDDPKEGEPCDKCESCISILEKGYSDAFEEIDAATNSGKDYIKGIVKESNYLSFSGKRKIWLFDEAHQLSRDALDGLLKPMEDYIQGSLDKKLICIFCTTEPEKMRETIVSRSLFFPLKVVDSFLLEKWLSEICEKEKISYEKKAIQQIVSLKGRHVRDSIKALEAVSLIGEVSEKNVRTYLNLDHYKIIEKMILNLGKDKNKIYSTVDEAYKNFSPNELYKNIASLCLDSWKYGQEIINSSPKWEKATLDTLYKSFGDKLLVISSKFSDIPKRATIEQLLLDLFILKKNVGKYLPENICETKEFLSEEEKEILSSKDFSSLLQTFVLNEK